MVRGKTLFICTECKKVFMAPDVEYGAMVYSVPMPCKRCGSRRTLPVFQLLAYPVYKGIWEADARCLYSNCWLIRCIKAYGKR